jgi:hypothetical protein
MQLVPKRMLPFQTCLKSGFKVTNVTKAGVGRSNRTSNQPTAYGSNVRFGVVLRRRDIFSWIPGEIAMTSFHHLEVRCTVKIFLMGRKDMIFLSSSVVSSTC